MSQAQIEQFYTRVKGEPALMQDLMANFTTPEDFTTRVVAKGKEMGYDFTYPEAEAWIEQQRNVAESGELSDMQLEAVSGGKSVKSDLKSATAAVGLSNKGALAEGIKAGGRAVDSFFSGW